MTVRPAIRTAAPAGPSADVPTRALPLRWQSEAEAVAPPRTLYVRYGKRALDLALGVLLLAVASPVIVLAAFTVLVTSGWPAFYGARRLGRDGRPFTMWKLRTMRVDAEELLDRLVREDGALALELRTRQKLVRDPRVTFVGRLLRRTSIDELPQLWNVVRGDMSLVGPRPYLRRDLSEADEDILSVRPGMTGPWQVGGRHRLGPATRVALDREYVRTISLARDLRLLALTTLPLVRLDGV
jgi:lipopolysaccharide/colanic/teichoic acid biosynthesis glycosyltransferase